jgi:tetratricopeptide (TPR) repeat protein
MDHIVLPAAEPGEMNPLPDIMNNKYIHAGYELTNAVTEEEARNIGKGMIHTILPYMTQDGYTRDRRNTKIPVIILENRYLKASFLPSLGGRLYSLFDKEEGRELLYVNPVFQPCNLGLRNAWFSGGVEFNVGIKGHCPLTCSPMFAVKQSDDNGQEILSLYEYERIRGIVYSINAWLPDDSRILFIRNVIENTSPCETFMYWWTNMAVPEIEGTRVLTPARNAFVSFYQETHYILDKTEIPYAFGTDVSYPENMNRSLDFFYKLPDSGQKWIAAVGKDGYGLIHFSESVLKGRKLFLWGHGNGGRHWGEYLAGAEPHSGEGYIEIQAGLAHTQMEHFIMPPSAEIAWTECFAPLHGKADLLHADWETAVKEAEARLSRLTDRQTADRFLDKLFPDPAALTEKENLYAGSGWGSLENRLRALCGLPPISRYFTDWTPFEDRETGPWTRLLDSGIFPSGDPGEKPVSYISDHPCCPGFWETKLREACRTAPENSAARNQYGVALYTAGKAGEAAGQWEIAADMGNPYALRNLAAYHGNVCHDYEKASEEILRAASLLPDSLPIAVECGVILCSSGRSGLAEKYIELAARMPEAFRQNGRIRLWLVRAYLSLREPEKALSLLTPDLTVPDIKEGELSLSFLWLEAHKQLLMKTEGLSEQEAEKQVKTRYPVPYELDFRMHE